MLILPRFTPKNQRFGQFYFSFQSLLSTFIEYQLYRFSLSNPFNEVKEGHFFCTFTSYLTFFSHNKCGQAHPFFLVYF
ncbi:hypothetical protein DR864_08575 [Runella rosea]|uniref:Uncharacterized protein n=1 Tax=Runella rosea TaxID=2259595 RepID=A0A344TGL5_9BACT|nr:hypothetical protein DR864_08575 [Runella rosea]